DMDEDVSYGFMYHGITYADEAILQDEKNKMTVNFWYPVMKKGGIVEFKRPEEGDKKRTIREMSVHKVGDGKFSGLKVFGDEEMV
uniref:mitochondrial pyruvate carrier family protein n=1 Tax=Segatella copri TaxID=165179 RepID=UPI001F287EAA